MVLAGGHVYSRTSEYRAIHLLRHLSQSGNFEARLRRQEQCLTCRGS